VEQRLQLVRFSKRICCFFFTFAQTFAMVFKRFLRGSEFYTQVHHAAVERVQLCIHARLIGCVIVAVFSSVHHKVTPASSSERMAIHCSNVNISRPPFPLLLHGCLPAIPAHVFPIACCRFGRCFSSKKLSAYIQHPCRTQFLPILLLHLQLHQR